MDNVLITGASSGVGKELAVYLSENYNVILNGRDIKRLEDTRQKCKNDAYIWQYDLSKIETLSNELTDWLIDHGLKISFFVHCAGVMKMVPLRSVDDSILKETFYTNVFSPELIIKVLSSRKINDRCLKSVVFVSSNISNRGASAFSTYGSSKAALDGLMRNLSVELAPNVRVNSVLPGGMITEMTKDIFSDNEKTQEIEKNYPLGIGTPEDIAPVIEFLLSDKSGWMTGQQIVVDGGRTIDITERSR